MKLLITFRKLIIFSSYDRFNIIFKAVAH